MFGSIIGAAGGLFEAAGPLAEAAGALGGLGLFGSGGNGFSRAESSGTFFTGPFKNGGGSSWPMLVIVGLLVLLFLIKGK
jgi:hypothetical protein